MTMKQSIETLGDERYAESAFERARWGANVCCPKCGSLDIAPRKSRLPAPYRCRDCRRYFSVKTGTVMHGSNLPLSTWALAIWMMASNPKGVSATKLSRDLGIAYRSAWHLSHRIRKAWGQQSQGDLFEGPVEVDETWVGGKEKNKHSADRRKHREDGRDSKVIVVGARDRSTGRAVVCAIPNVGSRVLHKFVYSNVQPGSQVFTDGHKGYLGMGGYHHQSVNHSAGEYVRGQVHTNGIESLWALLKRTLTGTYHTVSPKHLVRYLGETVWRLEAKGNDWDEVWGRTVKGMEGVRLSYKELAQGWTWRASY